MSRRISLARRLYQALNAHDPKAILGVMTEDFVGEVSAGMPLELGGRHMGRETMLREVWGRVFAVYDVRLDVDRYLEADDGSVVVVGNYVGVERSSGRAFDARFAHLLRIREDRISALEQITDSRSWAPEPNRV